MKKIILLLCTLIVSNSIVFAQVECKDIIYTAEGNNMIFDCCIKEVKSGNIVYYVKGGDTLNVAAIAITKDGQYFDLNKFPKPTENQKIQDVNIDIFNGHDYYYYQAIYNGAAVRKGFGVFFTLVGVGLEIGGIVILNDLDATSSDIKRGQNLIIAGAVFETI